MILAVLARYASDPAEAEKLQAMSGLDEAGRKAYREQVAARRLSVLELLDDFPSVDLPFNVYLELLPPMRPRYYSISSSPAATSTCHLTVGVLRGPARSGDGYFNGVASNHLGSQHGGQHAVHLCSQADHSVPSTGQPTHADDHGRGGHRHGTLPWVPAGAGRPGRAGRTRREVILFYGCRNAENDILYADELKGFETSGVTELQVAFSREPGQPRTFVQQLIERERDKVWDLIAAAR